jgi:putative membrane protein
MAMRLVTALPHLNAALNMMSFVFLMAGWRFIRRKEIAAHRACMISACVTSLFFFASYITYHAQVGSVRFQGTGAVRTFYLSLLTSHTILAATVPVLAIITLTFALRERFTSHRRIARWTFPIWAYVSVTGVLVYLMLYWIYPPRI